MGPDADARDRMRSVRLRSFRKAECIAETGARWRLPHPFVVPAPRIGEQTSRAGEQVLERVPARAEISLALAFAERRQVVMGVAVRAKVDSGRLHLEDLVFGQGPQRRRRRPLPFLRRIWWGVVDPINVPAGTGEGLRDKEDGRRQ